MKNIDEYIQLKAYAREYGAFMGLLWIASFACFLGSVVEPSLSFAFDFTIVLIPFMAHFFVKLYRDRIVNGVISFKRAFGFSIFIFLYATLILAIAQWAYFSYMDNGRLVATLITMVSSAEFKPVLEAYKVTEQEMKQNLELLAETRPIDFAMTFMGVNMFAGMIISWVVALFAKRTKPQSVSSMP